VARTRSTAVVADASVIVKWFVNEPFSEQSLRLKKAHVSLTTRVVVPSLARYEVLNALKYSGKFGSQELTRISRDLQGYQFVEIRPDERYAQTAVTIAVDYGIPIYDSSYLAIGQIRNIPVFTADERILERVDRLDYVHHIREYPRA
jgi:predicted nucleic acid-binding protein